jgi:hypothetical protein
MGIALDQALLVHEWITRHGLGAPLLALGVQHMRFTAAEYRAIVGGSVVADSSAPMRDRDFYASCGIDDVVSLDVSSYEGADVAFDLNLPPRDVPAALAGRFGIVLNSGTLEHVFHIPNALASITRLLHSGGSVIHIVPTHNCVDHGFYQISPTLLFDYYEAARYEVLEAASVSWDTSATGIAFSHIAPLQSGSFGEGLIGTLGRETILVMLLARKTADAVEEPLPVQSHYAPRPRARPPAPRWFTPYRTQNSRPIPPASPHIIHLECFTPAGGLAWAAKLPEQYAPLGDGMDNPIRSPLVLFEDGVRLGPPHASHDSIRSEGRGSYSHWGGGLWISTSDETDPNANGRRYEAWMPDSK